MTFFLGSGLNAYHETNHLHLNNYAIGWLHNVTQPRF
jgi:hypothetical protein